MMWERPRKLHFLKKNCESKAVRCCFVQNRKNPKIFFETFFFSTELFRPYGNINQLPYGPPIQSEWLYALENRIELYAVMTTQIVHNCTIKQKPTLFCDACTKLTYQQNSVDNPAAVVYTSGAWLSLIRDHNNDSSKIHKSCIKNARPVCFFPLTFLLFICQVENELNLSLILLLLFFYNKFIDWSDTFHKSRQAHCFSFSPNLYFMFQRMYLLIFSIWKYLVNFKLYNII